MSVELSLPCRVITLNVQLGPASGGTTLEALVAKCIRLKHDTTQGLAYFLGLPEPVIGDVVHSLWNRGWIWIDFDTGRLGLSDRAEDGDRDPANDPAVRTERREYLYEPLSQLIFSQREGRRRPHRDYLEVPADVEAGLGLADTDAGELRGAVQRLLLDEQESSVHSVVLSVLPAGGGEGRDASLRWVPLRVGVASNDLTGRIRIQVADRSSPWPVQAIARLSGRLADYVEQWPQSRFSTQLSSRATERLQRFPSAETLLERLEEDLERPIKQDSSAAWQDRQKSLMASARAVHQYLDTLARRRSQAELVTSAPARLTALREILGGARQQVVVVAGELSGTSLQTLAGNGLEDALKGGVQLVLLWGHGGADRLPANAEAQVKAWRTKYPHQLQVPKSSAKTSASMVLADDRFALVGAGDLTGAGAELAAVWLRPVDTGPQAEPSQAVLDLVAWTRSHCPDLRVEQAILTPAELAGRTRATAPAEREPLFPPVPDGADPALIPMWQRSWAEYRDMLAQAVLAVPEGQPAVEVLLDGEIDEVIGERVRHAARRLAIADDSTARQPSRSKLLAEIELRSPDDIVVHIDCPLPADPPAAALLERLPRVPRPGPPRGRVVLADDQVILGSVTPLAAPRSGAAARLSQIGLRIHHRGLADEVADWLGVPTPETPAATPSRSGFVGAWDALTLAQAAQLAQRDGEPLDRHFRRVLDELAEPWSVLARLEEAEVDPSLLAVAVAVVLRRSDLAGEHRAKWAGWMIRHLWERDAFVAAAVVSELLADTPAAVPASACVLAAAIEHPAPVVEVAEVVFDLDSRDGEWPHTAAAKSVGAAGLLAGYLLGGDSGHTDYIPSLSAQLPAKWREMADTAVSLYGRIERPLPVDLLTARDADRTVGQDRWRAIADGTEHLISLRNRFRFKAGGYLYGQITGESGVLTRLLRAAQTQDLDLRRAVAGELPKRAQVYFDGIVAQAGLAKIAWTKHRSFLDRVDEVFRLCRAAAAAEAAASTSGSARVRPADLAFAQWLRAAWGELGSEAAGLPAPYHLPLLAFLKRLRPIAVWEESRS